MHRGGKRFINREVAGRKEKRREIQNEEKFKSEKKGKGKMAKTLEQLQKEYQDIAGKIKNGQKRLKELFTQNLTVRNPFYREKKEEQGQKEEPKEITFKDNADANKFLDRIRTSEESGGLLLEEMCRTGDEDMHMRLFLMAKGFTPQDIVELMMNPDSENSKKMEEQIRGFRQEYFDQVIDNDVEKIAKMYVDACNNIKDMDMEWLRQANTPEKCLDILPMLSVFSPAQSIMFQTFNLGADMKPHNIKMVEAIKKQSEENGLDFSKFTDSIQALDAIYQNFNKSFTQFDKVNHRATLAFVAQYNGTIPKGSTLGSIGHSGVGSLSTEINFRNNLTGLGNRSFKNTEFGKSIDAFVQGQEGAVPPFQIFQEVDLKRIDQIGEDMSWGTFSNDVDEDAMEAPSKSYEKEPEKWKNEMENQFKEGMLMNCTSVTHCINLAQEGKYDQISGKQGDGERMIQVMNGDYSQYDQLSDLSKAAVSGRLTMEHPELFLGTPQQMQKAAEEMGLSLENPVYAFAMDGMKKLEGPVHAERIAEMQAFYAANKLDAALKGAPIENKKNLAKTLFMMQLGDGDAAYSENPRRRNASMLETLAQGGEIHFVLPKMTEQEKSDLKSSMPVGNTSLPNGVTQGVQYGSDNAMNVRVGGAIGRSVPQEGMEVDLRGMSAASLNACLRGLDEKISSMSDDEVDKMIGKLKGGSLEKSELAGMIIGFGTNAMGQEKQDMRLFSLAAKEADPPLVLDQNDFNAFDRAYSMQLDGERKYKVPDPLPIESITRFENALSLDPEAGRKAYFEKFLQYYKEQVRQMEMYADAAERMHRVRMENEMNAEPLNNVRIFSQNKEKELSEKFFAAKENIERMKQGIKDYETDIQGGKHLFKGKKATGAWADNYFYSPDLAKEVNANADMKGPSKEELERSMTSNFTAIDVEASTFREQENLENHKWSFLGVKYKNSGRYNDILNSMENLENMRKNKANAQNMEEYKKEYALLRDFCEDYIVSHKNPWTKAGKERLQMVKDTWEGMSNVKAENFDRAIEGDQQGKKLGDLNVHSGDRKRVSLQDLMAKDSERRQRLDTVRAERRAAMSRERENQRAGRGRTASM